jgi:hypothetical protein
MTDSGLHVKVLPNCYVIQRHSFVCVILIYVPTVIPLVVNGISLGMSSELLARSCDKTISDALYIVIHNISNFTFLRFM